jgi:hypothetical protein
MIIDGKEYQIRMGQKESYIDHARQTISLRAPIDIIHELNHLIIRELMVQYTGFEFGKAPLTEEFLTTAISEFWERVILSCINNGLAEGLLKHGGNPKELAKRLVFELLM